MYCTSLFCFPFSLLRFPSSLKVKFPLFKWTKTLHFVLLWRTNHTLCENSGGKY